MLHDCILLLLVSDQLQLLITNGAVVYCISGSSMFSGLRKVV